MPKGQLVPFRTTDLLNQPKTQRKIALHRLSNDFVEALADDWAVHRAAVIKALREKHPKEYLALVERLSVSEIEKDAEPTHGTPELSPQMAGLVDYFREIAPAAAIEVGAPPLPGED